MELKLGQLASDFELPDQDMDIRKADLGDVAAIKKIADLLFLDIPGFVWTTEDYIRKQIEKGEYFIAQENNKAVGVMSLRDRNKMLYIETLAVAKEAQSKGVGSRLVEFAKKFAKENNFEILRTTSFYEFDPRVKDFWIKHGFRLLDEPGEYGGHKFYRLQFKL